MTRRIFLDTEWTAPPWSKRSELMWIGLADEEGRSWYGISSEVTIGSASFIVANIHLSYMDGPPPIAFPRSEHYRFRDVSQLTKCDGAGQRLARFRSPVQGWNLLEL